ncbi:MAG: sigma-54-dependent Fis family transcriptional regulator [Planctomycetes bacterium]|nr:sigma-54-dependent Fis family transcriptional regulator [Planctomycetota bacterium]
MVSSAAARRRILIVDDEPSICEVLSIALRKEGYQVRAETDPRRALELFRQEPFDLVIQDLKMPEMDGIELLRHIKEIREDALVVVMTAYSTWDRAVEAMRLGAFNYLKKPFDNNAGLRVTVARAMVVHEGTTQLARSQEEVMQEIGHLLGDSPAIRKVHELIRRVAATDSTVLIHGQSGTGKELVARALHSGSPRATHPFVAVNCGAITETLLESELFGHVRGAFTGAVADKPGLMQTAAGGTFFLDEISEMSVQLQVKLLRSLEEREYIPVGSTQTRTLDVRFITATNRDLQAEVKAGRFREDLYYRLNVISIHLPPLKERREDIPLLAGHFLRRFTRTMDKKAIRFTSDAQSALERHDWPGNVRELENAVQRAVSLCNGREITASDLGLSTGGAWPRFLPDSAPTDSADAIDLARELAHLEIAHMKEALRRAEGNYTRAAQLLKMSLRQFRYKLQKYKLDRDP